MMEDGIRIDADAPPRSRKAETMNRTTTTTDLPDPTFAGFATAADLALPDPPLEGAPLNPTPEFADVVREQWATAGLALRREASIATVLAVLFTGFVAAVQFKTGAASVDLGPEFGVPAALAALLLPMAVWRGEEPGRRGYHLSMPVGHAAHALAKTVAGLGWTAIAMAAYAAWLFLLCAATGGRVDDAPWWQWIAPFVGSVVMYLLGSALTLRTRHPLRWIGAGAVGYVFLNAFRIFDGTRPLVRLVDEILFGRFGLLTVIVGKPDGPSSVAYGYFPNFGLWMTAAWLWLALSLSVFLAAAYRKQDG